MSYHGPIFAFAALLSAAAANAAVTCAPNPVTPLVRAEGHSERLGDIAFECSGTPGETVRANLYVFLSVPVSDRQDVAALTLDPGTGVPVSAGATVSRIGSNQVAFTGVNFTVPASGAFRLRIANLRGDVASQGIDSTAPVHAILASDGTTRIVLTAGDLAVGIPQRALLASANSTTIRCNGSPVPAAATMTALFAAGTRVFTTRATEGFVGAFEPGVRLLLSFTGFPAGVRLFVPDAIAGSDASKPTSGGDLGTPAAAGMYTAGSGSLLLVRVGANDAPVFTPPSSGTVALDGAAEVTLAAGSGQVVYQVVDANAALRESVHIPTFAALAGPVSGDTTGAGMQALTLAPPLFVQTPPPADCATLGDCASFPQLQVSKSKLEFSSFTDGPIRGEFVWFRNAGGGTLTWNASLAYQTGSGWAQLSYPAGGADAVEVIVSPKGLAPGLYQATLHVDAGSTAGAQDVAIAFTVGAPGSQPRVDSVVNAASLAPGPLAPGSLAAVFGARLAGASVSVTFSGLPARLLYTSDTQINLEVPPALGAAPLAQVLVAVDGVASAPKTVSLAALSPAIFPGGVLNLDYSVNTAANAVPAGGYLVIYATGLPTGAAGFITARLGDRDLAPVWAGPAPTLVGVQQVNLLIPSDLTPATLDLAVCGTSAATGWRVCSPTVKATIRAAPTQ